MATKINADTSSGLELTSDTSGQLELQSAGSTKVTVTSDGKVGIGTTSPGVNLNVVDQSGVIVDVSDAQYPFIGNKYSSSDDLVVGSFGDVIINADYNANTSQNIIFKEGTAEHMRIASSGYVTKPNQCYFRVRTGSLGNTVTGTITWNDEVVDTGNNFASNQFTAPVDGVYLFLHNNLAGANGNVNNDVQLYINGAALSGTRVREDSGSSNWNTYTINTIVNLSANDTVDVRVVAGAVYGNSVLYTSFQGYLLG